MVVLPRAYGPHGCAVSAAAGGAVTCATPQGLIPPKVLEGFRTIQTGVCMSALSCYLEEEESEEEKVW